MLTNLQLFMIMCAIGYLNVIKFSIKLNDM